MRPGTKSHRLGLTLIELILVMGLLATIAALSIPKVLGSLEGQYLRDEARRIIAVTRYARSEAISSGEAMRLWIRPDTGQYGIQAAIDTGDAAESGTTRTFTLSEPLYFVEETAQRGDEQEEELSAQFRPDGSLDSSSFERLTIAQNGRYRLTIVRSTERPTYEIEELNSEH